LHSWFELLIYQSKFTTDFHELFQNNSSYINRSR